MVKKIPPSNLETFRQQKPDGTWSLTEFLSADGAKSFQSRRRLNDVLYREFFLGVLVGKDRIFLFGECNDLGFVNSTVGDVVVKTVFIAKTVHAFRADVCFADIFGPTARRGISDESRPIVLCVTVRKYRFVARHVTVLL